MKGIQTLDLSSNQLSLTGAAALAKALWRCRSLHEIVLEESVASKDADKVCTEGLLRSGPGGVGVGGRGDPIYTTQEGVGKKVRARMIHGKGQECQRMRRDDVIAPPGVEFPKLIYIASSSTGWPPPEGPKGAENFDGTLCLRRGLISKR